MTDHTGIFKCLYIVQYSPFDDKILTWKFIYKVLHVNNLDDVPSGANFNNFRCHGKLYAL